MLGVNPVLYYHPVQGKVIILSDASRFRNRDKLQSHMDLVGSSAALGNTYLNSCYCAVHDVTGPKISSERRRYYVNSKSLLTFARMEQW